MGGEPFGVVELDVEDDGGRKDHERRHEREVGGGQDVRRGRAEERAHDAAGTDDGADFRDDFVLAEMGEGAREHGEDHGGERDGERRMDGDAETDDEQCDGDAGSARADKADERAEDEHGCKDHKSSFRSRWHRGGFQRNPGRSLRSLKRISYESPRDARSCEDATEPTDDSLTGSLCIPVSA